MGFGGGGGGSSVVPVAFGTAAARPAAAAGNANTAYYATDTQELSVSNGAAWNGLGSTSNYFTFNNGSGANFPSNNPVFFDHNGQGITLKSTGSAILFLTNAGMDVATVGKGLMVAEGSNAKQGTATLTAGAVTVANTSVTATSRIIAFSNTDGGTPGWLRNSGRTAGTSFTVTSSSGTDTSTFAYEIFEVG